MNSEELNKKIAEISESTDIYEAFGGKAIPYIGWYWRNVNFDDETYAFGVIPEYPPLVGFMENNKWDYGYVEATKDEWGKIKSLLIEAVNNPNRESLEKVNLEIQALAKKVKKNANS